MCALQDHAFKVQHHRSPFSPLDIVSHLRDIGRGLSYSKQEDAHEFMRLVLPISFIFETCQSTLIFLNISE